MDNQKVALVFVILILLAGNAFFGMKYFDDQKKIEQVQAELEASKKNEKVLNFTKLFIEKVLKADKEVGFDDRIELETAVRDLNDAEILSQWKEFINSKDEKEAQQEVKDLLGMLVGKIR